MACKKPRIVVSTGLLVTEFEHMNETLKLCPPRASASALLRESLKLVMAIGVGALSSNGFLSEGIPQTTIEGIKTALKEAVSER